MALEPQDREPSVINRNELPDASLRRAHPEDVFVTSSFAYNGVTQLSDKSGLEQTGSEHNAVRHPDNPYLMLTLGETSAGGSLYIYDTIYDEWKPASGLEDYGYEPISSGASSLASDDDYAGMGFTRMSNGYLVAAGGTITDEPTDAVFVHDGSSWSELTSTLPTAVDNFPLVVEDPTDAESVLVFGGTDTDGNPQPDVTRVNVVNDTTASLSPLPYGVSHLADGEPVYDGKVYLGGEWEDVSDSSADDFFVYDVAEESYTQLSGLRNAFKFTDGIGLGSFGNGSLHEINGYFVAIDGSAFHGAYDHGYYNPETDRWVRREIQAPTGTGSASFGDHAGSKSTIRTPDEVLYFGGTGMNGEVTAAYIPEREPPEFQ